MGVVTSRFEIEDTIEVKPRDWEAEATGLSELALSRRADLKARQMGVAEAAANLQLAQANRYGNPIVGPAFTYDATRIAMVGVQVNVPLPFANKHRGEILQSEAEQAQAALQVRQAEFAVKQEVAAALARLAAAQGRLEQSRTKGLPTLMQAVQDMEKLFQAGEPGVDVLRVIDVRRKLLRARDNNLDALWSVRQALIDLAAATGESMLEAPKPNP